MTTGIADITGPEKATQQPEHLNYKNSYSPLKMASSMENKFSIRSGQVEQVGLFQTLLISDYSHFFYYSKKSTPVTQPPHSYLPTLNKTQWI